MLGSRFGVGSGDGVGVELCFKARCNAEGQGWWTLLGSLEYIWLCLLQVIAVWCATYVSIRLDLKIMKSIDYLLA